MDTTSAKDILREQNSRYRLENMVESTGTEKVLFNESTPAVIAPAGAYKAANIRMTAIESGFIEDYLHKQSVQVALEQPDKSQVFAPETLRAFYAQAMLDHDKEALAFHAHHEVVPVAPIELERKPPKKPPSKLLQGLMKRI